jgi:hypothetical protein
MISEQNQIRISWQSQHAEANVIVDFMSVNEPENHHFIKKVRKRWSI